MPVSGQVTLLNKYGLHQRPAMKVIETSSRFKSEVFLIKEDRRCNAKSIIDVIMLAAETGTTLTVEASGPDETEAIAAMQELFAKKFYLNED